MQLFIDIDGVLLNFERTFVRWLNRDVRLGLPEDYEAESWDFTEVLERRRLQASWLRFLESDAIGRMPPLVEPERFNDLASTHSVHLVTNFPRPFMDKRHENLQALGFRYESLHYCGLVSHMDHTPQSKAEVIGTLREAGRGSLFVDDHPDNCLDVHANCPDVEVWLMSRRFNRDFRHPEIQRAIGWNCLFDRIGQDAKGGGNGNGRPAPVSQGAPLFPKSGK